MKPGCDSGEHAVVYISGVDPKGCYLPGERQRGLDKEPIEVSPADSSSCLSKQSRIRFGKAYAIEWNVRVKDIGTVVRQDVGKLLAYYEEENREVA